MWKLGDRTLKFGLGNNKATQFHFLEYINGTRHLYWILTDSSFAVQEERDSPHKNECSEVKKALFLQIVHCFFLSKFWPTLKKRNNGDRNSTFCILTRCFESSFKLTQRAKSLSILTCYWLF